MTRTRVSFATLRRVKPRFDTPEHRKARGPNGRPLCRWCGQEVPTARRTWCSEACVVEYRALNNVRAAREFLTERDGAQCQLCGEDAEGTRRLLKRLYFAARPLQSSPIEAERRCAAALHAVIAEGLQALGLHLWRSFTEVDHRVPLSEGGEHCLENLRLLCSPCHLAETRALAARTAARRAARREP